jgi:hypothetical protein
VNTTAYSYLAAGTSSGAFTCPAASISNAACLVPQSSFLTTTATSNNLLGARQMQFSAKLNF